MPKFSNPRETQDESIQDAREFLRSVQTEWIHDGCVPPNWIRTDGMGNEIARVDRWCGGFQDTHFPTTIGWNVCIRDTSGHGSYGGSGVILTSDFGTVSRSKNVGKRAIEAAIEAAKTAADEELARTRKHWGLPDPTRQDKAS